MEISVIIPSYKPDEYLWECLESLSRQTLSSDRFETILILNGCNEPWKSQIDTWIASHSEMNINFIQTDTPGVSNARNIGIDAAKGEYIAFIDDDDYVSESYLENLLCHSSQDCVALTDAIYFDGENFSMNFHNIHHSEYVRLRHNDNPSLYQVRRFLNGPVMKLVHKDIIGQRRFDRRFTNGEDSLFMALISDRIKSCQFCTEEAVYYRRVRFNSATTKRRSLSNRISNSFKAVCQFSKYWIKNPFRYNCIFMASRIVAQVKILFFM